ncbi:AAA family ATPase [Shewanella sp.]|uniref:AAA family ATPase n=1 Tax=Shewanella sp. TaxID=50422 RepID=UPI003A9883D7
MAHDELLLPSQEALIQRLTHLASYGQQLVLLRGVKGSGKTSLLTALANELDNRNLSLVSCPQHVSEQEIRRKIIMQLLPDPLFDDEVSLADTLLRFTANLQQPIHILIDDADHLPLALWAELLLLTQLHCAGYPITITASVSASFAQQLQHQLPAAQRALLLPITIPALNMAEREGLYQTLLTRSQQRTFTPRKIIGPKLAEQSGTPAEVLALLALALHGTPAEPRKLPWIKWLLSSVGLLLFGCVLAWYLLRANTPLPTVPQSQTVLAQVSPLLTYAERLLEPAALAPPLTGLALLEALPMPVEVADDQLDSADASLPSSNAEDSDLLKDARSVADVATAEVSSDKPATAATIVGAKGTEQAKPAATDSAKNSHLSVLPRTGYTLQLASVQSRASLQPILAQLADEPYIICRHQQWWVVFVGNYSQRKDASAAMKKFTTKGFSEPWLRAWKDIQDYQPQSRIGDEISQ